MTRKQIFIRADGGSNIGLGHIIRCMALGNMLKNHFDIHFFCKSGLSSHIIQDIKKNDFFFHQIENDEKFLSVISGKEIVILDKYEIDSIFQKNIRQAGCKLVCIDDLHDKEFFADLIINHAPQAKKEDYQVQDYTDLALGTDFALLRPEFLKVAKKNSDFKCASEIKRIFICFGGSDFYNFSLQILNSLPEKYYEVKIIVGTAYKHIKNLEMSISEKSYLDVEILTNLSEKEMIRELQNTDLAIVPASGVLLETIAVGIPVISGYCVDNQKDIYKGLLTKDIFYDARNFDKASFRKAFSKVTKEKSINMMTNQKGCIDGHSPERILEKINNLC